MLSSDISHIFPFPTISKLASAILTPRSFLVFLIFRPFSGCLTYFGQYGYTGCSPWTGSRWSSSTCAVKPRDENSLLVRVPQRWACLQKVEICHIPWGSLCRNVNTSNFTPLTFNTSPAGYTRWAFIKLKNLDNIGFENCKYMRFIFWRNVSCRMLKIAFPRL